MKIVFMGSANFALYILNQIVASKKYEVMAVYTSPIKKRGRGMKEISSPVAAYAEEQGIVCRTPSHLNNNQEELDFIKSTGANTVLVVQYGFIIPADYLNSEVLFVNIHPSTLPNWRGAAPIQRAIEAGDKEISVSLIEVSNAVDAGGIFYQSEALSIENNDTYASLAEKLMVISAEISVKYLVMLPDLTPKEQSNIGVTYANKITKDESLLSWQDDANVIERKIRAFISDCPMNFFLHNNKIIIYEAEVIEMVHDYSPGEVIDNKLTVACGKNLLRIILLQRAGRKVLHADEFLRGVKIKKGTHL